MPDLLLPEALSPLITGTIFAGHIQHFVRVDSTNTAALEAAQKGAPEGMVFVAEEQTAGRGRGGHQWHSALLAGIYLSVVLRPPMAPADAVALSLMAGMATADAVREVAGITPDLRWPNDLVLAQRTIAENPPSAPVTQLVMERKFAGILIELNAEVTRIRHAVVGIGINVNQEAFPEEVAEVATSLRLETGRYWPRVTLAAALLQSLDREYRLLQSGADARAGLLRRFE